MLIESLSIEGFRNFANCEITFDEKTLIVGGNDAGKTNLLYALRILFDPSLSQRELELTEGDFNIQTKGACIRITAKLSNIHEPCALSALRNYIKGDTTYIQYENNGTGNFRFLGGGSLDELEEQQGRTYIKGIRLEYVGGSRDVGQFIRKQQNKLLDIAKVHREDDQIAKDETELKNIQTALDALNARINDLSYIKGALDSVNAEMNRLSATQSGYKAAFIAGNTDSGKLLGNLNLTYLADTDPMVFGGEGRSNQLYFSTWLSEQKLTSEAERVTIYAIEEPEAHLHPQQQRRLASYLSGSLQQQVLMTTHSPQIAERMDRGRVLRLYRNESGFTMIKGCDTEIDNALASFGYRMNSISAETFFSNGVLLVEGPSERIFYLALSKALGYDLDQLNISVLSVDGVGFKPYVRVCTSLGIPFALRTDNDEQQIPGYPGKTRLAGLERAVDIAKEIGITDDLAKTLDQKLAKTRANHEGYTTEQRAVSSCEIQYTLKDMNIFLAAEDLERDLVHSPIGQALKDYLCEQEDGKAIEKMQRRKAENMYSFISSNPNLSCLRNDAVATPLLSLLRQKGAGVEIA